ncbi:uncharacterized protein MYCGRDRAFT_96998 [Zymoseptoria tritici IPO323]|uniref:Uncharacterized protein n=1 Tax=Zymoseptoria tritici (strain CBS 115943 / IPO323) TaxID=336722 RepID=F9XNK4_ZYMTI|nr:uncharacterized protein MYCGRDRAFT_96998 [Zymoseptoria tritici IPO323]EGP82886.1 hypothetical protein MYCGRDRAFT_96998 [Zymoseptoria tritici IPO323]
MPTHPPTDPPNAIALSLILSHISTHPHRLTTRPSQTALLEKLTRTHKFPYRSPYWGNTYHDAKSLRTVLGNVMRKYGLPITIEEEGEVGKMEGVERLFHYGEEVLDVGFVEAVREAAGEVGDIGVDGIDSDGEEEDEDEGGGSEAEELKALLERDDSEDEEYQPRKGRMREAKRKAVVKIRERRKRKRELDSEDESGSESAVEDGTDSEMDADGEVDSASDTDGASNASTNDSPPPNKRRMSRESSTNRRVSTIARSRNLKRKQLQAQTLSKREQKSGSESDVDMDADGEDEPHSDDPSTASSDDDLPSTKRCVKRQRQTPGLSPTGRCRSRERNNSSISLESAGHDQVEEVGSGSDADAEGEDEEVECRFDRSASITSASSNNIVVASRRCGGDRAEMGSTTSLASAESTALACRRLMSEEIRLGDAHVEESVEVAHDGNGEDGGVESDSEMDAEGEEVEVGGERERERKDERQEAEDVHFLSTSDAFFEDAPIEPYDLAERQETPIMLPPLETDESWDILTTALNEVRRGPNSADERTSTNEVGSDRDADGEDEKDEEVGTYAISIASSSDEEAPSIRSPAKRLRIDSVLHASSDEETLSIVRRAKRSKSRSVSELREAKRQKFASPSNASSSDDDDYGPLRGRTMTRQKTSSTRSSNSQVPPPRHAAKRQRATSTASSTASTASRPRTLPPTTLSTSPHPTTRNDPLHPAPESASPPRASQPTGQAGSTEPKAQTTIDLSPDHQPAFVSVDPSIPNPHHCASSIEHTNYGKGSPSPPASAAAASASAAASAAQNVTQQEGPSLAPIVRHVHGSHAHHALPPQGTISAKRAIGRDRAENPVIQNDKGCGVSKCVSRKGQGDDKGGEKGGRGRGRGAGFDHAKFRKAVERMNEGINRAVVGLWEDMMMGGEEEGEGQGEEEVVVL